MDNAMNSAFELLDQGKEADAFNLLSRAAESGCVRAQVHLGWMFETGKGTSISKEAAEMWYKKAARSGSAAAQFYLATLYYSNKDYQPAINYYEMSAGQNFAPAFYRLGTLYEWGVGVDRDSAKAENYFKRATSLGHLFARRHMAGKAVRGEFGVTKVFGGILDLIKIALIGFNIGSRDITDPRIIK